MKNFIILIILFLSIDVCHTQTIDGVLYGVVKDSSDIPMEGVSMKLKGTYLGAVSDYEGSYRIEGISPGIYTLQVSSIGFVTVEYTNINIEEDTKKEFDVILSSSSYTVDQEILVIGDRPLLDIEETSSKHIISSDDIDKTIVTNIKDIVTQQAGVVKSDNEIFIRGGRNYENSFLLDGVSVQDPLSGTGFGLQLSANSLEEVEVITGGYNAEFG